jgi:hypothetical protein
MYWDPATGGSAYPVHALFILNTAQAMHFWRKSTIAHKTRILSFATTAVALGLFSMMPRPGQIS